MMSIGVFNKILKLIDEGKEVLAIKDSYEYISPRKIWLNAKSDMDDLIDLAQSNEVSFYVYDESKENYWEMEEI